MDCGISKEQLWSWVDRDANELASHLAICPRCRIRAAEIQAEIDLLANDTSSINLPLPEKIGPYQIKNLLGEGGQALVFEATQQALERPVALKVLKGGCFAGKRHIQYFRIETRTLAKLKHPGIATIFEAGRTEEGQHYFAMELVSGCSLTKWLTSTEPDLAEQLKLFCRICNAVHYAHLHFIIHRDLKPSNIMIDENGQPKILDFGLARITDADMGVTLTQTVATRLEGTPRYMSPEQARGNADEIDARSDIYALGVILYEMLTGQSPFPGGDVQFDSAGNLIFKQPKPPSSFKRQLRGDLNTITLKAMARDPERRYQSVVDLAEDIQRYLNHDPILAEPPSLPYLIRKTLTKYRTRLLATLTVILLILSGFWGRDLVLQWRWRAELTQARTRALTFQHTLESGEYIRVLGQIESLSRQFPDLRELQLVRAHALLLTSDVSVVCRMLEPLLLRDPTNGAARNMLSEIYMRGADPKRAELLAQENIPYRPVTAEQWYLMSYGTLDIDRAVECIRSALTLDPDNYLCQSRSARLSDRVGDWENAYSAAEQLLATGEDHHNWEMFRINLLVKLRRTDEALASCNLVLASGVDSLRACRTRAVAYLLRRDYQSSLDNYNLALKLDSTRPGNVWVSFQRATIRWIMGQKETALSDLQHVSTILEQITYADIRRYLILESIDPSIAQSELSKALDQAEDVWVQALLSCLNGDISPQELIDHADPEDLEKCCEAFYYAGEACRIEGNLGDARRYFQQAIDTDLRFDIDSMALSPMNEYFLARWRLDRWEETTGRGEGSPISSPN